MVGPLAVRLIPSLSPLSAIALAEKCNVSARILGLDYLDGGVAQIVDLGR